METQQNNLRISGIKVIAGGLKGLEVSYETSGKDERGRDIIVDQWQARKVPIGDELAALIKSFRFYLFDIYGYDMTAVNDADMEILGLKMTNGSFILSGKMKVLNGEKVVAMNTPLITSDEEYDKYMEVQKLFGQLFSSVAEYMEGKHVMSDQDLVKRYMSGKKDKATGELFDAIAFEQLPVAEQEARAIEVLSKLGGYAVIPMGDLGLAPEKEVPDVQTEEKVLSKTEESPKMEVVKETPAPNFDALEAEKEEEHPEQKLEGDDDDMVIMNTAVKTGT